MLATFWKESSFWKVTFVSQLLNVELVNVYGRCPIGQGYGLTETCAGGTFSQWEDLSVGRVGPPVAMCYIKV